MLTWNSHHIDERIKDASAAVRELQELLALVQGTTKQAADLAADWAAHSLIEVKEGQVRMPACLCMYFSVLGCIGSSCGARIAYFKTSTPRSMPFERVRR